ncbi:DUF3892 domain-containing protein [Aminipila terrae]|uniref:DUF3892 domain-containing protein n=1 Tax=Aminipila terrae TaxID=2697030 RepID=A0A6P1ME90_9FIRM|nr:DUF3892 domain-containing protein [Aminipila terrae]QHI73009.1 DUF3892 domain-containing protein [Aminipila terrae]
MNDNRKIIKIRKDQEGEITDIMLDDETVVPVNHAILMAKDGLLEGTIVVRGKNGGEFLRNDPNGPVADAISDLPTFK